VKLLLLSSEFPPGPGGIATHAEQLALEWTRLGNSVTVLTSQDYAAPEEIESYNQRQPFEIIHLPHARNALLEGWLKLRQILSTARNNPPDVLISSGERSNWLMLCTHAVRKIPWLAVGHGSEFAVQQSWARLLTRTAFNKAERIVCVSSYTCRRMLACGIHPGREFVINNGAEDSRLYPLPKVEIDAYRREHGLRDQFVLLTVGNVTLRKGHDLVIHAIPRLKAAGVDVHYQIIGMPAERDLLEKLACDLGVSDCVTFLGKASNRVVLQAMNACDVYVMPSRTTSGGDFEGYGIVVTEAALCGKTAVVTRDSGLEDAVIDQVTGLLVPQENPDALSEALLRMACEPGLRERLAAAARQRALTSQTWRHVAHTYQDVLEEMLARAA